MDTSQSIHICISLYTFTNIYNRNLYNVFTSWLEFDNYRSYIYLGVAEKNIAFLCRNISTGKRLQKKKRKINN